MSPKYLGEPQIKLAGLCLWIHSRQFPENNDYWDGNWVYVTAQCKAHGAVVSAEGALVHLPEIQRWENACKGLLEKFEGVAALDCMEPELSVELIAKSLGHITMTVSITPDHLTQQHQFEFAIDQSYLPLLIKECQQVLKDFPIRNNVKTNE